MKKKRQEKNLSLLEPKKWMLNFNGTNVATVNFVFDSIIHRLESFVQAHEYNSRNFSPWHNFINMKTDEKDRQKRGKSIQKECNIVHEM